MFCSKEGASQVKLKLGLISDEAGHNFTFTSPIATAEREEFKKALTPIITRNKLPVAPATRPPVMAATAVPNGPFPVVPKAPLHQPITPSRPPASRATSVLSERRTTPVIAGTDPASDFRLRKRVLMSNHELGSLHKDLVMSGQITEAEFWDGREVRLECPCIMYCSNVFHSTFFLHKLI